MSEVQQKVRDEARKILESGEVSMVIGYGEGSVPFKTTPIFIKSADDADKLVWNPACVNNLAVYLKRFAKNQKVGIVAKPCDIRSIIQLIHEKQISRENVYIIGMGCEGVVDSKNLEGKDFRMQDVVAMEWDNDGLRVTSGTQTCNLSRSECVKEACNICDENNPVMCDVQICTADRPDCRKMVEIPQLPEDRRKFWAEQFSKCIRCYACRQVCPNCYCESCFADRIEPKWTAKKATTDEAWMFHATRAMHLAGRCINCGECERVCPVNIPAAELIRELADVIKDRYDFEAGDPNNESPLLGSYEEDDHDPASHGG
ncbi:MAG: Coenzyme F420 hydrogenase/dehydrogenase, beta subunit C-terminal domain [Armatimonadota bacterium]